MKIQIQQGLDVSFEVPVTAKELVLAPYAVVVIEKLTPEHLMVLNAQARDVAQMNAA